MNPPAPVAACSRQPPFWRWHAPLAAIVVLLLFGRSLSDGWVVFSNDAPLGLVASQARWPLANFTGYWQHLHWLGGEQPGAQPNITQALYALAGPAVFGASNGPIIFAKFYTPLCLLILGLCAGGFFRSLGLSRAAALLGGLAAMLNSDAFSNACWGLPSWPLTWAMTFLSLSALVSPRIPALWMRLPLAGFAIGVGLMEGYDVAAIFSIYAGIFCVWVVAFREGKTAPALCVKGALAASAVAVCAAWMSMVTLTTLVGTQIAGVAGTQQDEKTREERWLFATSGSLPKIEALRVIIPGLFGYRMDTPDGGQYWGAVNRSSEIEKMLAKAASGAPGEREQAIQTLKQLQGNTGPPFRHSGSGEYAGVLVVLLAIWAVAQSLRGRNSPFSDSERRMVWFWTGAAVVSLLLAFGKHAPFYQFVYKLPYFSTIRNPIKFMQPFHVATLILFAHGLEDLCRRCLSRTPALPSLAEQLKRWWASAPLFEKRWTTGLGAALGAALVATLIFASSRGDLVQHLQLVGFTAEQAGATADFSLGELGWFLLFFAIAAVMVTAILSGALGGSRAKWAGIALGLLVVADMSRANSPWIIYVNYKEKYRSNPIIDFLRERPHEHRVAMGPNPGLQQLGAFHASVYHDLWLQHHFPYYNIQSLDIPQEPRVAREKIDFLASVGTNPARYWQLTNTRYLFGLNQINTPQGPIHYVDLLNAQLDPQQRRFRVKTAFSLTQEAPDKTVQVATNAGGQFALIEFTGALPRAKLYADWQVSTDLQATLTNLVNPAFNPERTVLLANQVGAPPPADAAHAEPGTVEFVSYAPKRIRLRAEAKLPCVLLLNDRYHPAWKVWVDGQPAELLRANFIVRAVMLQPGTHEVEFRFQPSVKPLFASLSAIVCGLVLCGFVWFRRGASPAPLPAHDNSVLPAGEPSAPAQSAAGKDKPSSGKRRKSR